MKKIIITAAVFIFISTAAMASPAGQKPQPTQEDLKHQKLEDKKEAEIDKLVRNEETRARKARDQAQADYNAEIEKRTRAAVETRRKKEEAIERKRVENIKKGSAKIEQKYDAKHAKVVTTN